MARVTGKEKAEIPTWYEFISAQSTVADYRSTCASISKPTLISRTIAIECWFGLPLWTVHYIELYLVPYTPGFTFVITPFWPGT